MPLSFDTSGLTIQTIAEIKAEIEAALQDPAAFGPDFDVSPDTPEGNLIGVFADRERSLQELLQSIQKAANPEDATGTALDDISALAGTTRLPATSSTIVGDFVFTAAATITAGSIVQHNPNGTQWQVLADIVAPGAGTISGSVSSIDTGEIQATTTTDWTIITPIVGWASFESTAAVDLGRVVESDADLRARRKRELATLGAATVPAIIANIAQDVDGVESVFVFENRTDTADGAGRPPHSIEVLVEGGLDQDVADGVFVNKPAGIETFGTEGPFTYSGTVASGQAFGGIYFSRVTPVPIGVTVTVTTTGAEGTYPVDGDDLIKAAVVAHGGTYVIGEDVIPASFIGPVFDAFTADLAPFVDVAITIADPPGGPFVGTPLTIAATERATFVLGDVTVVQV